MCSLHEVSEEASMHYLGSSKAQGRRGGSEKDECRRPPPEESKMHVKSDSEVTSLAPSSPADRSPRRPVYYVQSPSRDSHDGEKTTASFHSTPVLSPAASPRHSHSSVGPHSRESSSSRFSGSMKPGGSGGSRRGKGGAPAGAGRRKGEKTWKDAFSIIEEEGLLDDEQERRGISRRCCYILVFVFGFIVLFSFFALILWGASRSQKPVITMKSITFESFIIQAGTDASLVPTDMATLNSTVKFTFRNRGTFFGVHVSATPFVLTYDGQLIMASGNMKNFYQSRKGQRNVEVVVLGNKVPLYGGGPSLTGAPTGNNSAPPPVPLSLNFTVQARAYVLGELVKPKFEVEVQCSVTMEQTKLNTPISLKKSCGIY